MKKQHNGIKVLLLFLIGVPVIVDIIMLPMLLHGSFRMPMTLFVINGYLSFLPFYLGYLLLAYLIRRSGKNRKRFPVPKT